MYPALKMINFGATASVKLRRHDFAYVRMTSLKWIEYGMYREHVVLLFKVVFYLLQDGIVLPLAPETVWCAGLKHGTFPKSGPKYTPPIICRALFTRTPANQEPHDF